VWFSQVTLGGVTKRLGQQTSLLAFCSTITAAFLLPPETIVGLTLPDGQDLL
jgi:hypothetical protein